MNTWHNLPGKALVTMASLDPRLRRRARAAAVHLSPDEAGLFLTMSRYDLAHSLVMAGRLRDDPLLYRAALLHDAGKLRLELSIATRWLYTTMEIFTPGRLRDICARIESQAGGGDIMRRMAGLPSGWRRGLFVQLHHGEIGGEILARLGSDVELVRLVGDHQAEPEGEAARKLKEMDDLF